MIDIQNVSKCFGTKRALDNINIKLKLGEVVALIGENGAGKTTLMRIMSGYIPATEGTVLIDKKDIEKNRLDALWNIGYVPEISSLYGDMFVYDFLYWIAGIHEISDKKSAIINAANTMQITNVLAEKIDNLSKGFKKRVEISSALLHQPKFLILDEPTDGLDPNQKYDIRNFIRDYAKKNTVLISTHTLEDAQVADRVIMLAQGKIVNDTPISSFQKISATKDLSEAFRILSKKVKEKK